MEQQSAAVCHGRERAIAATFLDEAAHALSAMELESPEALDEIFEKLPHIERHKCLGVICLKLEPGQAAVPAGLILSTAPEGVYQMVSIQCRDTKKDTKKGGKRKATYPIVCLLTSADAPLQRRSHVRIARVCSTDATIGSTR